MRRILVSAIFAVIASPALAVEGMWQPAQLPAIADQLKEAGLELDPNQLTDLTGPTMGAIVSLGFCTASFVSPQGLATTNHHCAYGAIQYNSTAERNLISDGFLAKTLDEELPGDPNLRMYVTEEIRDVTKDITRKLKPQMDGLARYQAVDRAKKDFVAKCEKPGNLRCDVYSFHGGASYQLIRQREIKDVRLVYAPAGAIGKFGGDLDNWMWPRHTGDFAFLRAYVDKNGQSATYSKDNVPFQPKHFLPVSAEGVDAGDYVMVAGYPGRTSRYRLSTEMSNAVEWQYPTSIATTTDLLNIIDAAGRKNPEVAVKYASAVASYNNGLKNANGQLEGLAKADAIKQKQNGEAALDAWLVAQGGEKAALRDDISALRDLIASQAATRERDSILGMIARTSLYNAAYSLQRLSLERGKPEIERESGFQPRDEVRIEGNLKQIERRSDPAVDAQLLSYQLKRYVRLAPAERIAGLDAWLGEGDVSDAVIEQKVAALYAGSKLSDTAERLRWFNADRAAVESSQDSALVLLGQLMPALLKIESASKARAGEEMRLRPRFMEAMIAYNAAQGRAIYPDANSSLRVSFGKVQGLKRDGLEMFPFTTAEGIVDKTTGVDPFDTPQAVYDAIVKRDYGRWSAPALGTLPVDFLADLDITGGNSGSPTIDAKGRLVGLAFDGVWDSVSADWIFNQKLTRSIQVDVRYMLWVMDKIDHADNLLREMKVAQ